MSSRDCSYPLWPRRTTSVPPAGAQGHVVCLVTMSHESVRPALACEWRRRLSPGQGRPLVARTVP
jgi:hypothetical protein